MAPPTNRVSMHLLQAQAIHNEVRAQRDAAVNVLRAIAAAEFVPEKKGPGYTLTPLGKQATAIIERVDAFTKAEGETQL